MKKYLVCLIACLAISTVFTSCEKEEESFDETLLIGEWKGNETIVGKVHEMHYKYTSDFKGLTWDATEDMTEEDGQKFTWSLKKSELTHIHVMEIVDGQPITKIYKVTELTASTLKYEETVNGTVVKYSYTKA